MQQHTSIAVPTEILASVARLVPAQNSVVNPQFEAESFDQTRFDTFFTSDSHVDVVDTIRNHIQKTVEYASKSIDIFYAMTHANQPIVKSLPSVDLILPAIVFASAANHVAYQHPSPGVIVFPDMLRNAAIATLPNADNTVSINRHTTALDTLCDWSFEFDMYLVRNDNGVRLFVNQIHSYYSKTDSFEGYIPHATTHFEMMLYYLRTLWKRISSMTGKAPFDLDPPHTAMDAYGIESDELAWIDSPITGSFIPLQLERDELVWTSPTLEGASLRPVFGIANPSRGEKFELELVLPDVSD